MTAKEFKEKLKNEIINEDEEKMTNEEAKEAMIRDMIEDFKKIRIYKKVPAKLLLADHLIKRGWRKVK